MPIIRGGYGYGAFSASDYGTEGVVHEGAASTSASSSSSSGGYTTTLFSASGSASSGATCDRSAILASGAAVSSTASIASVGEQFVLKETDKLSYGTGAYGYNRFDLTDLQTIVSATAAGSSATGNRVQSSGATFAASASVLTSAERIHQPEALSQATASGAGHAVFIVSGQSNVASLSDLSIEYIRERNTSATSSSASVVSVIAREMWEPIPANTTNWTKLAS